MDKRWISVRENVHAAPPRRLSELRPRATQSRKLHASRLPSEWRKEIFRISLLKVSATNLTTRNMCGNSEYWDTVPLTVVEAIDQMQVPGPAAPGANCQCSRQMRFGSGGKSPRLFMPHVHPLNILFYAYGVRDAVQRVANHAVDSLNTRFSKNIHQQIRHFLGHAVTSFGFGHILRNETVQFVFHQRGRQDLLDAQHKTEHRVCSPSD